MKTIAYRSKSSVSPNGINIGKTNKQTKQTKVHYNHIAQTCNRKNLKSTIGEKKDILCTEREKYNHRLFFRNFASLV